MALTPITPRDHLQRLVDLGRKTWRYWWLIALFAVVGAGLSLAFAMTRPRAYQSWATLFYQERITSALLSPGREEVAQRNIGDRYRELLLAREQLDQVINDPSLDPFPDEPDPEIKIEKFRQAVRFVARGAMAFRIEFVDSDADRAKRVVEKLTKLLRDKDERLRNEQATATVTFATDQKEEAAAELGKRERLLNEFLAKHPEFAADSATGGSEGGAIRLQSRPKGRPTQSVKERQLERIMARLNAPPDSPPIAVSLPPTAERLAAEANVKDAQREYNAAQRELEEALAKFTDKHPSAIKAQDRVAAAKERMRQAQAAVPPDSGTVVRPATAEDRAKLEKERAQLEKEIREEQSRSGATAVADNTEARVVKLESENSMLRRDVKEQRDRVESLADSVFRSQMDARQKAAEQGGRLSVVDPAFKPVRPSGPGKSIFMMAGMVLFLALGLSFAIGLAVIDDRMYRRDDLDQLGIAVLGVIPPARARPKSKAKPKRRAATTTTIKRPGDSQ